MWLPACGGVVNNPSPHIKSVSPVSVTAGSPTFTMTINGSGFSPQSTVGFGNSPLVSIFLSENQITATVPFNFITAANPMVPVQISTPSPGGGNSNIINFVINPANNPIPAISSISPSAAFADQTPFNVSIMGSGLVSNSQMTVNGSNRPTGFISASSLSGSLQFSDLATTGTIQIAVLNPAPGGGGSNSLPLSITNPAPLIAAVNPKTTAAGGTNVTFTVAGTGFASTSQISINGTVHTATFVNNAQLTTILAKSDLAAAQISQVTVINPPPGGGISNIIGLDVLPGTAGQGFPELADVDVNGVQANQGIGSTTSSGPVIDTTGRFVAYASASNNLAPNDDNGVADIFQFDSCLNAPTSTTCLPSTILVSKATDGTPSNGASSEPSMDSSGRFIVFTSVATDLVPGFTFTGNRQVILRDTCTGATGCTPATRLISVSADGKSPAASDAFTPAISPDGRFVAFISAASNLFANVAPTGNQIFMRDTCFGVASGCNPATTLITIPNDTMMFANGSSGEPIVGTGGQFVAFSSTATNLVSGVNAGLQQVFVRNTCTGVAMGCTAATSLISASSGGVAANAASFEPSMSPDGRFFAFASTASNLDAHAVNGVQQVFIRDTCTGATGCTVATALISIAADGMSPGGASSEHPQLDKTGQFVAFASNASNLVANDTNNVEDVFARKTCIPAASGCTASTVLVSASLTGAIGNAASLHPAIAANSHFLAFISSANNLVPNDTNGLPDIFLGNTSF